MKKLNFKMIMSMLMLAIGFSALAQPDWDPNIDCDCDPMDDAIVCALDPEGNVFAISECLALCLDLEIVEGDCELGDWEGDGNQDGELDCDCDPMDEAMVCIEDEFGIYPFPACLAECLELTIVDGDCDDNWEDEGEWEEEFDCDCDPEDEEMVCVEDEWGIYSFPACFAECFGLNIIEGDCDNNWDDEGEWENEFDCDCDPADQEMVCVEDEWGVYPFPACLAACLELNIVDGDCEFGNGDYPGDCEGDWGDFDCDCTEDDDAIVCVENEFGEVYAFPACIAECLGLTIVDGDCTFDGGNNGEWESGDDCDCDPMDEEMVCIEDEWGVFPFPACLAECLGFNIVDGDCEYDEGEWENEGEIDCDCDMSNETMVCIEDDFGIYAFPACLAECLGLNIVDGDCGLVDEDGISGGNVGLVAQSNYTTSKGGSLSNVLIYPNPTNKNSTISFEASQEMLITISVTNLSGQTVSSYSFSASKGNQNVELSLDDVEAGIYLVTLVGTNDTPLAIRVTKF